MTVEPSGVLVQVSYVIKDDEGNIVGSEVTEKAVMFFPYGLSLEAHVKKAMAAEAEKLPKLVPEKK